MGLYENIRKAAADKGYSINQLEKELSFSRSYIAKFKTITPSADKIQRIADFLGVSVEYLMTGQTGQRVQSEMSELEWEVIRAFRQLDESKREVILDILHVQDTEKKKDSAVSA